MTQAQLNQVCTNFRHFKSAQYSEKFPTDLMPNVRNFIQRAYQAGQMDLMPVIEKLVESLVLIKAEAAQRNNEMPFIYQRAKNALEDFMHNLEVSDGNS